jgi:hypothetical protein
MVHVSGEECSTCHAALRADAVFCSACGAAVVAAQTTSPDATVALAIDLTTLAELRVNARGLLRLRVANLSAEPLAPIALATTWSGDALPPATADAIAPASSHILTIAVTPTVAGIHEVSGELVAGATHARFAQLHVRVGGDGPQLHVVNIDQSSARVVDNSRSSFGAEQSGGLVGDGRWHDIPVTILPAHSAEPSRDTTAPLPLVDFIVTTAAATYRMTETLGHGDIATVYAGTTDAGHVAVKIADQSTDNDLLQHEARVLGLLLAEPDKTSIHFPTPRDQFRTADGRLGSVFDRCDGVDLTTLRDRFRARGEPGVPAKHLIWILRRVLAALGRAHQLGILHGNLDPSHVLVRGRDHMVWVVDWCWAVVNPAQSGQGFKALNEGFSPPEVRERGRPTPASDIYALGKCAIHALGGNPADKSLPDVDARLARFLRYLCVESQGGRGQDAWQLYLQIEHIREQIWGAHEFVPLIV